MTAIQELLGQIEVCEPSHAGSLSVFGLLWPGSSPLEYLTLDQAIETGGFEVTELNASGAVKMLMAKNPLDKMVFLMAGEELVGAKQNRVLDVSLMIPARTNMSIPVSCVERGRWSQSDSLSFSSDQTSAPSSLRAELCEMSGSSYESMGYPSAEQSGVWDTVDATLAGSGSLSGTSALHQVFEDHKDTLNNYAEKLICPAGCHGAAFFIQERLAGIDLFDNPQTLARLWSKLLRSYTVDAMLGHPPSGGQSKPVERSVVTKLLRDAGQADQTSFDSLGRGQDVRLSGQQIIGACLVVESQPVHTAVFARGDSRPRCKWSLG